MKIVHICLQSPYNDNWGYQDNLLPKYQRRLGHDVVVITTDTMHDGGKIVKTDAGEHTLSDGIRVIRLAYRRFFPARISDVLQIRVIYPLLQKEKPDFIMVHGLGNFSVLQVARYKRKINPNCAVIADNHMDYYNGKRKATIRSKALRASYVLLNRYMQHFYTKVYGVTPWRKKYCEEVYHINPQKTDLLVMGADDDMIHLNKSDLVRSEIRRKYQIPGGSFLVVTGGKLDAEKNIPLLAEAVSSMENVDLIIFGDICDDAKEVLEKYKSVGNIHWAGWVDSADVYDLFLSADLTVFPGSHSVLWEQAAACGVPCLFKHYDGMHHVDVGGNCEFLYENTADEIRGIIAQLLEDKEKYMRMKRIAIERGTNIFSYSEIARKSLVI